MLCQCGATAKRLTLDRKVPGFIYLMHFITNDKNKFLLLVNRRMRQGKRLGLRPQRSISTLSQTLSRVQMFGPKNVDYNLKSAQMEHYFRHCRVEVLIVWNVD